MSRPATSRLKVNPPLGSPPTLEWRPCTELQIDPGYQRSILQANSQTLIRRIAQFWDWGLCQPLAVARRDDGTLMVVDGQHRLEAARLRRDIAHLPCVITSYANAGDEAAAFVALNQQRRPLTALDLFKAAVAAEDEAALAILKLLKDNGLSVAPHMNYISWKPGMVSNIPGIKRSYRVHGPKTTSAALEALSRGFHGLVLRYAGSIFPGLCDFIAEEIRVGRVVDRTKIADTLGSLTQKEWKNLFFAERARTGAHGDVAARIQIAARYALLSGGQHVPLPKAPVPNHAVETIIAPSDSAWCDQCDRRVSGEKAALCNSAYCSLKRAKAA